MQNYLDGCRLHGQCENRLPAHYATRPRYHSLMSINYTPLILPCRTKTTPGLIYVDLNDFKPVNDKYGHGVGDDLLKAAARRMLGVIREGESCFRIGDDYFFLIKEVNPAIVE